MIWKNPKNGCREHTRCYYCEQPLSTRHEHDHYPVPRAAGGGETVPACVNCHDFKDRTPFEDWPEEERWRAAARAIAAAVPPGLPRIFFAKWLKWFAFESQEHERGTLCNRARAVAETARAMMKADDENMRAGKAWVLASDGEEKDRLAEAADAATDAFQAARQRFEDALAEYDAHPAVRAEKSGA